MTKNNSYFRWFWESLRDDQRRDYGAMSLNEQKNWYIRYLELHYHVKKEEPSLAETLFTSENQEELKREFEGEN